MTASDTAQTAQKEKAKGASCLQTCCLGLYFNIQRFKPIKVLKSILKQAKQIQQRNGEVHIGIGGVGPHCGLLWRCIQRFMTTSCPDCEVGLCSKHTQSFNYSGGTVVVELLFISFAAEAQENLLSIALYSCETCTLMHTNGWNVKLLAQ